MKNLLRRPCIVGNCILGVALVAGCQEGSRGAEQPGTEVVLTDSGDSGVAGAGGTGTTAANPTRYEACPARAPAGADSSQSTRLGFAQLYDEVTLEGHVSSVAADQLEVTTSEGTATFEWRGPALDAVFLQDEPVQLVVGFTPHPLAPPKVSIIRSQHATAAVVDGGPYGGLRREADSTVAFGLDAAFPRLQYDRVACCALESNFSHSGDYRCDDSALQVHLDGNITPIAGGATGSAGEWSVTNVNSTFYHTGESYWHIQVTLLGPATPRVATADTGI